MNLKLTQRVGRYRLLLLALVAGLTFYISLYVNTEPWRVYGNDLLPHWSASAFNEPRFWRVTGAWILSAALLGVVAALLGQRWRCGWLALLLFLPAFMVSRGTIINSRYRDSTVSCANHSGVWWRIHDYNPAQRLPDSTEFLDLLKTFWGDDLRLSGARCPGYRLARSQTGVVYVGGGLQLDSLPGCQVLVAFCDSVSHPPPHDHQHALIWESQPANGRHEGFFTRECTDTAGMIRLIETALQQAVSGLIPYSPDAQALLRAELRRRRQMLPSAQPATNEPTLLRQ